MLVMNWVLVSTEDGIDNIFCYCQTAKELSDSISIAYAYKKNNARTHPFVKDLAQSKYNSASVCDYYAKSEECGTNNLYHPMCPCCAKEQERVKGPTYFLSYRVGEPRE